MIWGKTRLNFYLRFFVGNCVKVLRNILTSRPELDYRDWDCWLRRWRRDIQDMLEELDVGSPPGSTVRHSKAPGSKYGLLSTFIGFPLFLFTLPFWRADSSLQVWALDKDYRFTYFKILF